MWGGPHWGHMEGDRGKAFDSAVVTRLWGYLEPYKLKTLLVLACVGVYAGMQILGPYLLKVAIDEHLIKNQDIVGLTLISIGFLLTLALSFGAQATQNY